MSLSLAKNVQTCKVNTGAANVMMSQRFENKNDMLCPKFNGHDNAGRRVCKNSFVTRTSGCDSAEPRIIVENNQRPNYSDYVTLNIKGITGPLYGSTNMYTSTMNIQNKSLAQSRKVGGHFGGQTNKAQSACSISPEADAMAQIAAKKRARGIAKLGARSENFRKRAGW